MHVCTHSLTLVYEHTHTYMYTHMYTRTRTHTCTHAHVHTYIHTYTHTEALIGNSQYTATITDIVYEQTFPVES